MLALFLQATSAQPISTSFLPEGVISGGVASLILWFWRQDRASYEKLLGEFRVIVQDNTKAITELTQSLKGK